MFYLPCLLHENSPATLDENCKYQMKHPCNVGCPKLLNFPILIQVNAIKRQFSKTTLKDSFNIVSIITNTIVR